MLQPEEARLVIESRGQLSRYPWMWKDLAGSWPLLEGRGLRTFDVSGNGNHGTLTGGPTWARDAKHPYAIDCDADTKYILLDNTVTWAGDKTIAWWGVRASGTYGQIFARNGFAGYSFITSMTSGTLLRMETDQNNDRADGTLNDTDTTGWHHYALVQTGTSVQMYQDGVALSMADSTIINTSITADILGSLLTGSELKFADPRIYSRPLSATEVLGIYQAGSCAHLQLARLPTAVAFSAAAPAFAGQNTILGAGVI